ncbi:MAG: hypothetical protein K8W52_02865 [Deltaproteobacteria bacterium]|nr:hypothetical protein [Deltaproteobacteria bacterium]
MTARAALALAALLAAAPAVAGPDAGAPPADGVFERARVEVAPGKHPIHAVTIENALGDVRVEGHDGKGVVILAMKRAPDDAALDRLRVSLVPDPDGAVRIVTAVDGGREAVPVARSAVRIDLVIQAPRDARVIGRVEDGKLVLVNMDAGGELDTGGGAITVENVSGSVTTRSLAGAQSLQQVFGSVDAEALDANLTLDTIRGDRLTAAVHDGRIDSRRVKSRSVELRSTRGNITFDGDATPGGQLVIASLRGDIAVTIRTFARVQIHTSGAHVVAAAGGRPIDGGGTEYGTGPRPTAIELRSRFGDIQFALVETGTR